MSTRAVIAEPWGDVWRGRYHHSDGYPSGLGAELHAIRSTVFAGDLGRMRQVLVTDEPAGWSTIIGADWSLPSTWPDDNLEPCGECGLPMWAHYRQYYATTAGPSQYCTAVAPDLSRVQQFDHKHVHVQRPQGPRSYSSRGDSEDLWIDWNGDDYGTEWCYILAPFGLIVLDTDSEGFWAHVAVVPWDAESVDWDALDHGTVSL